MTLSVKRKGNIKFDYKPGRVVAFRELRNKDPEGVLLLEGRMVRDTFSYVELWIKDSNKTIRVGKCRVISVYDDGQASFPLEEMYQDDIYEDLQDMALDVHIDNLPPIGSKWFDHKGTKVEVTAIANFPPSPSLRTVVVYKIDNKTYTKTISNFFKSYFLNRKI